MSSRPWVTTSMGKYSFSRFWSTAYWVSSTWEEEEEEEEEQSQGCTKTYSSSRWVSGVQPHLGHEVAGVPGVQLSVERQTSLLTLLLLQFEDDCALFITQRLQLTSQLLWETRRTETSDSEFMFLSSSFHFWRNETLNVFKPLIKLQKTRYQDFISVQHFAKHLQHQTLPVLLLVFLKLSVSFLLFLLAAFWPNICHFSSHIKLNYIRASNSTEGCYVLMYDLHSELLTNIKWSKLWRNI